MFSWSGNKGSVLGDIGFYGKRSVEESYSIEWPAQHLFVQWHQLLHSE